MPIIDMPIEKLKVYNGRNPRPQDFDEFWDKSLAELDTVVPNAVFDPYDLPSSTSEMFKLTFTSTKGAKIFAKFAKPKGDLKNAPAVLIFHGLSGSSPEWSDLIKYTSQGYVVAAMDTRGQGGYSDDVGGVPGTTYTTPFMRGFDGEPEDLHCRDLFLDTAQLARVIAALDYVDETRMAALGGSQGGALTLACASLFPSLKLCLPTHPYLCDYKRVWEMDLAKGAYEGMRYYLRSFDPTHEHIDEFFEKLGYIDLQFLAPRIKAKVLLTTGLMDTTCPPSTQFAAYNKITSEKSYVLYPDFAHEHLKGNNDLIFRYLYENL
jgi:cephalosporin-C deacetylase